MTLAAGARVGVCEVLSPGVQVWIDGGSRPRGSADGRELFFRSSDRMMMVRVEPGPPLAVSRPVAPVHVVLNWFDELRARVPVP